MDKTLKLRAYQEAEKHKASPDKQGKERNVVNELEKKSSLLEEEKTKSQDLLKTIVQLRESLKQEQEKASVLEAKVNKLDTVEGNQLAKKNAQLEEERKLSLEYMKTIEQLKANLKQELERSSEMLTKMAALEAKINKLGSAEEIQLAKKNAQLEEEKKKSLEHALLIDQLRESIKQDHEKMDKLTKQSDEMEHKVKELSVVLSKIANLATGGK
jgi:DNA repair exonuclease SbcCD ATPase subunit